MKSTNHIEIVSSSIKGLSSMSHESRIAIRDVLQQQYDNVHIALIDSRADLHSLIARKPDLVFLGMKYIPGELSKDSRDRIWLSTYLEKHGIPHTGSPESAHRLELNKPLAKQHIITNGLPSSPFVVIGRDVSLRPGQEPSKYPLFVKPTSLGGGEGVDDASIVHNYSQLQRKVNQITNELHSDALIEKYLPGREFTVAILQNVKNRHYTVMPLELIPEENKDGKRILSNKVKSANTEQVVPVTDKVIRRAVTTLAEAVFRSLGARDYGRIDIRLDAENIPHFLEANLIPSLIDTYGSFPKACMLNQGMTHETLILRIVDLAKKRSKQQTTTTSVFSYAHDQSMQDNLAPAQNPGY